MYVQTYPTHRLIIKRFSIWKPYFVHFTYRFTKNLLNMNSIIVNLTSEPCNIFYYISRRLYPDGGIEKGDL